MNYRKFAVWPWPERSSPVGTSGKLPSTRPATRPGTAAIIQGAAQAHAIGPSGRIVQLSSDLAAALGEERVGELHARGADMSWDRAIAYTLTQITQALNELESGTQP